MKLHVHNHTMVIYIQYKFLEIPFICFLVMAEDGKTDGRTDNTKSVFHHLLRGITNSAGIQGSRLCVVFMFSIYFVKAYKNIWLLVGEPKSRIVQKHTFFAPERYTAGILYTDSLNSAWYETTV